MILWINDLTKIYWLCHWYQTGNYWLYVSTGKKTILCIHKNNVAVVDIDNLLDIYLDITFVVVT